MSRVHLEVSGDRCKVGARRIRLSVFHFCWHQIDMSHCNTPCASDLTDLKNQVENLRLLIASVESDLARQQENRMVAESTEAWLLTLQKNLSQVERDTEEAFEARRELTNLLVERITISRNEEGHPQIDVTYRFGPPESADGVQNSEEFVRAHGQGGGEGLLRGHPKITVYEVAVEREAERYYGPD